MTLINATSITSLYSCSTVLQVRFYVGQNSMQIIPLSGSVLRANQHIKRAQELGFSLDEIATLLEIDEGCCRDVQNIATHKLVLIQEKISDLERLANGLKDWMQRCQSTPEDQPCPLIHTLLGGDSNT